MTRRKAARLLRQANRRRRRYRWREPDHLPGLHRSDWEIDDRNVIWFAIKNAGDAR